MGIIKKNISWCKSCLNASTRPRITFDERGFCNACQWMEEKKTLNWKERENLLIETLKSQKKNNVYDCLVPVSGGKDGTYVAYQLKEKYKINLLTVTSRPSIELSIGKENLHNFATRDFDHVHVTANRKALKKLNKLGFIKKGSPYYGWLVSIFSTVIRTAVANKIDLIFYGEDGEVEYGGSTQNKNNPFFDLNFIIKNYFEGDYNEICKDSGLSKEELHWFSFDKEVLKKNIKLTHYSYFEPWDPYRNYLFAKKKKLMVESESANVGTFTNFAQNDQAFFALHTYLMYLKFGFGRATQDAGIEIRRGSMNRDQGLNLIKLYDNIYPDKFIKDYLDYYEMSQEEFNNVLDTHVNKELFKKINGKWEPQFVPI